MTVREMEPNEESCVGVEQVYTKFLWLNISPVGKSLMPVRSLRCDCGIQYREGYVLYNRA